MSNSFKLQCNELWKESVVAGYAGFPWWLIQTPTALIYFPWLTKFRIIEVKMGNVIPSDVNYEFYFCSFSKRESTNAD